jgi:ribosome-associated protein
MEFQLAGHEYIELNKLLKLMRLVESGGMANVVIEEGLVTVNGSTELQKRKKLRVGDKVVFEDAEIVIK